jgi:sulfoxide reductase catalytic subunit YedY
MKRYNRITIFLFFGLLGIVIVALLGCWGQKQTAADGTTDEAAPWATTIGGAYPLVDGLHVTGQPIDIDIDTYRLTVSGAVETPLSLSLTEIQDMEAQREFVTLACPGFFVDEGHWTGVKIGDLLSLAGVEQGASRVTFVSADGSYSANLRIEEVMGEGMLIAYSFEDKPLPKVHGYPLRVVAKDQQGNRWVKWLGTIVVQ